MCSESTPLAGRASQGWKERSRVVAQSVLCLLAELSRLLQASEVCRQNRILEAAVGVTHCIQERIRGDGSVTRVGNGGTDEPDRTSVTASRVLLAFCSAVIGLELVVEFKSGQDNRGSVGIKAVLGANLLVYVVTGRALGVGSG